MSVPVADFVARCDGRARDRRIGELRERIASMEAELAELLAARGSRPVDGSDQPGLFSVAEPNLFDVEG